MEKSCVHCGQSFNFPPSRAKTARYCSQKCSVDSKKKPPNTNCACCGKEMYRKPYRLQRAQSIGSFCSAVCAAKAKQSFYLGAKNPNFRNRRYDDGYPLIEVPHASLLFGQGKVKLHRAVCYEVLGVTKLPPNFHIHHRDCNKLNNAPENLVVLSNSDHRWLHQQFGVATLRAFCHGKISLETLVSWADNEFDARRLLPLNVLDQTANDLTQLGIDMEIAA